MLFVLLSSCQESGTLQGYTLSVKHCTSGNNAQYKVLEVTKAPLSQCPALLLDFLRLSEPPSHHVRSVLLPRRMKPPTPPRLVCPPPSCHWGLFSELQNCQQRRASRKPDCDPMCSKRSLTGRVLPEASASKTEQWSIKTAP